MIRKVVLLILTVGLFNFASFADNENKFGEDSATCVQKLSLYREFIKQKNYVDAVKGWRVVFSICPEATRSIYSDGVKIYSYFADKEKDEAVKQKYVDTILMVYDQRIKYYGDNSKYPEGWILGRKGVDMYQYRPDSTADILATLSKSVELQKNNTEAGVLPPFMACSVTEFNKENIDAATVVNNYVAASDIIEFLIAEEKKSGSDDPKSVKTLENLVKAKENIDNIFVNSKAATCDVIVPIFEPKFKETPDDLELLKKIVNILNKQDCSEGNLFYEASKKLNDLEPSSLASHALAKMSIKREQYSNSIEFYKKAVELETVDSLKAQMYYEMAIVTGGKIGNYSQARSYAYEAAKLKPNWGMPYIIIGTFYGSSASSCGDDPYSKKIAYWAAVDKCNYAKSIDSDTKVASEANTLIFRYKGQFPNKEEAFFHGVEEGMEVKVGCWINETTTARF